MKPAPIILWAVVVRSKRSEWIHPDTLRRLRKDAWAAILGRHVPEHRHALELRRKEGKYRVTRVVVTEKLKA